MPHPTVPQFVEFLSEITGFPATRLMQITRRLREHGLISQAARGANGAAATPRDAALIMLVGMMNMPPVSSVVVAEFLLASRPTASSELVPLIDCNDPVSAVEYMIANSTFFDDIEIDHRTGAVWVLWQDFALAFIPESKSAALERFYLIQTQRPISTVTTVTRIKVEVLHEIRLYLDSAHKDNEAA